jgi:hypothetical protein
MAEKTIVKKASDGGGEVAQIMRLNLQERARLMATLRGLILFASSLAFV